MLQPVNLKTIFQQAEFDKAIALVSEWDFSLTKQKMLEPDYAGWPEERIEQAEKNYKRYLSVTKALDGYQLVPNGDVDRFWHEHILDTRRYVQDCAELFAGFLHHYPYFGMRGEVDNRVWLDTASQSTDFWAHLFGEHLYEVDVAEAQKCPQSCPGVTDSIQKIPQKCPQACPGRGITESIDKNYPYLPEFVKKAA